MVSGQGLSRALEGADVVVDVSDPAPADGWSDIDRALSTATRNVVGACVANHIRRLVVLTIAGIDDPAFDGLPNFEAKRLAKNMVLESPVPASIVKSTQAYEFATNPAAVTYSDDEVAVEDWLIQPIAADSIADVLVEAALAQTHMPRTIAGPHPMRLPEVTAKLLARQGDERRVRAVRPPRTGFGAGALLAPDAAIVLGPDIDTWLHTLAPTGTDGSPTPDGHKQRVATADDVGCADRNGKR